MLRLRHAAIATLSVALYGFTPTMAAEAVGEAVRIKTDVSGQRGPLAVRDPVHRDERIRTSRSGLGQFVFRDGSKLAVGAGSSVVIDKFVFDDSKSVQKLTVAAAKGTFRWISGNSKHSAYEIVTPAGTIGVRGTVFDFYIGGDGTTAMVLLSGAAEFCGRGGCQQLTRRCDCVIAKRNGSVTETRRVNRNIFNTLGNRAALPFLSGDQKLSGAFRAAGGSCGLTAALEVKPPDRAPLRATTPQQQPKPTKPDKPRDKPPSDGDPPHNDRDPDRDPPDRDPPQGDQDRPHDKPDRPHADNHDRPHDDEGGSGDERD
ncbi:FecR family protein [Ensifer aridi]|uniref:FecR family protein n=1 Tax=Ensifer aridi TaxID=1708715 RepID=UPI000614F4DE|nr:FecR domain-containing protein [Ensifer aridi]